MTGRESQRAPAVGVLVRGDARSGEPAPLHARLQGVFDALAERGLRVEPIVFADDAVEQVRESLLRLDGVLVWVDPIVEGRDRSRLDALLREVASTGVWVSAHPDVILNMGTKDVLVKTRDMPWGSDCVLYATAQEMGPQLRQRLASAPRVLKQHRGNGGNGVWRVELLAASQSDADPVVSVLHGLRGSALQEMRLSEFVDQCGPYFEGSGCMVEQPYQQRLGDGMIRCYQVQDRVAGFGHQFVTALLPPPDGSRESPPPPPRLYYGPDKPEFQAIKAKLEDEWLPQMQSLLRLDRESLPAIWDADFLYGPRDSSGADTYVLCEINVSSVYPFPDEALAPLAGAVAETLSRRRAARA